MNEFHALTLSTAYCTTRFIAVSNCNRTQLAVTMAPTGIRSTSARVWSAVRRGLFGCVTAKREDAKLCDEFARRLSVIDEDCFLVIASNWSCDDLLNLEQVWPQLRDRVDFALEKREQFSIKADDLDAQQLVTKELNVLRCGPILKRVQLKSRVKWLLKCDPDFVTQLAANCPNIEEWSHGTGSQRTRHSLSGETLFLQYAEVLAGNCHFRSTEVCLNSFAKYKHEDPRWTSNPDPYDKYIKDIVKLLRNCDRIEQFDLHLRREPSSRYVELAPQLVSELITYVRKRKMNEINELVFHFELTAERFYRNVVFDDYASKMVVDILEGVSTATRLTLRGTLHPANRKIIEAINGHRGLKLVAVRCVFDVLDLIREDLIEQVKLVESGHDGDDEEEETNDEQDVGHDPVVFSLRKKQFPNFRKLVITKTRGKLFKAITFDNCFPNLKEIKLSRSSYVNSSLFIKFLNNRGDLVTQLNLEVRDHLAEVLAVIANSCVNLVRGSVMCINTGEPHVAYEPDPEVIRKLDAINPKRRDARINVWFLSEWHQDYEMIKSVYGQLERKVSKLNIQV